MGLGATFVAPDGTQHRLSVVAPGKGCNNEAEARALMAALQHAKHLGAEALLVYCDSRVVVDQLVGDGINPIAPIARLARLFDELRAKLKAFGQVTIVWIPRHRNKEADALARAAAGLTPKKPNQSKKRL